MGGWVGGWWCTWIITSALWPWFVKSQMSTLREFLKVIGQGQGQGAWQLIIDGQPGLLRVMVVTLLLVENKTRSFEVVFVDFNLTWFLVMETKIFGFFKIMLIYILNPFITVQTVFVLCRYYVFFLLMNFVCFLVFCVLYLISLSLV